MPARRICFTGKAEPVPASTRAAISRCEKEEREDVKYKWLFHRGTLPRRVKVYCGIINSRRSVLAREQIALAPRLGGFVCETCARQVNQYLSSLNLIKSDV